MSTWDSDIHATVCKMDRQQDLLYNTGNSGQYYVVTYVGVSDGKASAYNAGDPGKGRSLGEGNGNPLQYSCLENLIDRGAGWATAHSVAKSWMRLSEYYQIYRT